MAVDPQEIFELEFVESFADRAIDRIHPPFKGDPRVEALIGGMSDMTQLVQEVQWEVLTDTLIETAVGDALDQIGELFEVQRNGLEDHVYRRFVRGSFLIRLSEGTPDDVTPIYKTLTDAYRVKWWRHKDKGWRMDAFRRDFMSDIEARKVDRQMERIRPVASNVRLVEVITDPDTSGTGYSKARTLP